MRLSTLIAVVPSIATSATKVFAAATAPGEIAPAIPSTRTRVDLHPFQIAKQNNPDDILWSIEEATSVNTTINDIDFTLSAANGTTLNGNWNKIIYAKFLATLGERLVGTAISTDEDSGVPITLTIDGLADGNHSLLAWHNSWNSATTDLATVSVSVDGKELATVGAISECPWCGMLSCLLGC